MESRLIVVDTDVIIDFFQGLSPAADVFSKLISFHQSALTSISVFELYAEKRFSFLLDIMNRILPTPDSRGILFVTPTSVTRLGIK